MMWQPYLCILFLAGMLGAVVVTLVVFVDLPRVVRDLLQGEANREIFRVTRQTSLPWVVLPRCSSDALSNFDAAHIIQKTPCCIHFASFQVIYFSLCRCMYKDSICAVTESSGKISRFDPIWSGHGTCCFGAVSENRQRECYILSGGIYILLHTGHIRRTV